MKKRILSTILVLAMLVGIFSVMPIQIGAADADDGVLSGEGTENDPYIIAGLNDWKTFVTAEKSAGDYYKVTATTLDFTGKTYNQVASFQGTFDGNGVTITGVNVDSSGEAGLFSCLGGVATFKNFALTDSTIKGNQWVGGVVCCCNGNATFENIYISKDVSIKAGVKSSNSYSGGLLGGGAGNPELITVRGCVFAGTITADGRYNGGFIGSRNGAKNIEIYNSIVLGKVPNTKDHSCGFIGHSDDTNVVMDNCIYAGGAEDVYYYNRPFFKNSASATVTNCYTVAANSNNTGVVYGDVKITDENNGVELIAFTQLVGLNAEIGVEGFTKRDGDVMVPSGVAAFAPQHVSYDTITWANWDGTVLKTEVLETGSPAPTYNGETPTRAGNAYVEYTFEGWTPTVAAVNGNATYTAVFTENVIVEEWEDTNGGYVINNGNQWLYFVELVNDGEKLGGKKVTLGADLDFAGADGLVAPASGFAGYLDGAGKTIKNLNMSGNGDIGLFDALGEGAIIENLVIKASTFTAKNNWVAPIACCTDKNVTIRNIYIDEDVTVISQKNDTAYAAGILGGVYGESASNVVIENCVFAGTVIAKGDYVAGILGSNYGGTAVTVRSCLNVGNISTPKNYAAGIAVAYGSSTVIDCVNAGAVSGKSYVAGISTGNPGGAVSISGCYSIGDIYSFNGDNGGEIIAENNTAVELSDLIGNAATVPASFTVRKGDIAVPTGCPVGTSTLMEAYLEYGASVRIDTSSEKTTGIRWTGIITDAYLAELAASGKNYSFGMIIAPVDYINGDFTKAELDKLDITTTKYKIVEAVNTVDCDGYVKFYCALGGIQKNNLGREFAARIYVCVDGEYTYFNYNESANARSISYIAGAAFNDYKAEQTEGYENAITTGNSTIYSPYTEVQRNTLADYMFTADSTLATGASVRVMSLNILSDEYGDKLPVNGRDLAVEAIINEYNPAVIGLQETSANWYSSIKNLYNGTTYNICEPKCNSNFWDSLFGTGENYLTTIMYDSAQATFVDSGVKEYSAERITQGNMIFWAKFTDKSGNTFVVINTHWDINKTDYAENRAAQAEELAAFIETFNCPVIALGDFNTKTDDALFTDNGYEGDNATLNSARFTAETVITDWSYYDHIFGNSGVSFKAYNAIKDNVVEGASDHKPIYADIAFN